MYYLAMVLASMMQKSKWELISNQFISIDKILTIHEDKIECEIDPNDPSGPVEMREYVAMRYVIKVNFNVPYFNAAESMRWNWNHLQSNTSNQFLIDAFLILDNLQTLSLWHTERKASHQEFCKGLFDYFVFWWRKGTCPVHWKNCK